MQYGYPKDQHEQSSVEERVAESSVAEENRDIAAAVSGAVMFHTISPRKTVYMGPNSSIIRLVEARSSPSKRSRSCSSTGVSGVPTSKRPNSRVDSHCPTVVSRSVIPQTSIQVSDGMPSERIPERLTPSALPELSLPETTEDPVGIVEAVTPDASPAPRKRSSINRRFRNMLPDRYVCLMHHDSDVYGRWENLYQVEFFATYDPRFSVANPKPTADRPAVVPLVPCVERGSVWY